MLNKLHRSLYNYFEIFVPAGNYMFKVNNRNTRTRCEIRSPEWLQWHCSGVFNVNLNIFHTCSGVSINCEQVNTGCGKVAWKKIDSIFFLYNSTVDEGVTDCNCYVCSAANKYLPFTINRKIKNPPVKINFRRSQ